MILRLKSLLVAAVAFTTLCASGQGRSVSIPPLRGSMIVTTDWLADHLRDPTVVVLHIARTRADYDSGHIAGAGFVALSDIAVTRKGVPNELPPVADLQKIFQRVGVSNGSRVILYGELQGLLAARAYFTLDYLGHGDRTALLDGGLEKWRAEERPVTKDAPHFAPGTFTPKVNSRILVDLAEAQRISNDIAAGKANTVLMDSRPPDQYSGDNAGDDVQRPGHIPGAVNLYWMENIESKEDPQMKPPPDLRKVWTEAGATPGRRIVTYCRTGIQASYAYFTAKFLGYDAAMYDGSFQQWSNTPGSPVVAAAGSDSGKAKPQ